MMVFCLLAELPQQGRSTGYYVGFKLYRNFGAYGTKILVPQARFSDAKTRLQLILIHRPQLPASIETQVQYGTDLEFKKISCRW